MNWMNPKFADESDQQIDEHVPLPLFLLHHPHPFPLHSSAHHTTPHHTTPQHNTTQHSTAQHSTTQHNTTQQPHQLPQRHAPRRHGATAPRRHAATPPRRHATTPPRHHATTTTPPHHHTTDVSETVSAGSSLILSSNMHRKTVEVISQTLAWMLAVLQSSAQSPTLRYH